MSASAATSLTAETNHGFPFGPNVQFQALILACQRRCNNWPLYWGPSGTSNATNRLCLRGLPGGEPAASEGDYFIY